MRYLTFFEFLQNDYVHLFLCSTKCQPEILNRFFTFFKHDHCSRLIQDLLSGKVSIEFVILLIQHSSFVGAHVSHSHVLVWPFGVLVVQLWPFEHPIRLQYF